MTVTTKTTGQVGLADAKQPAGNVLILGLGNILYKDEGIGAHLAQEMAKEHLPENVEVIDGGTSSLDVLLSATDLRKLIIIDALRAGGQPGTVYRFRFGKNEKQKLERLLCQTKQSPLSLHQVGLLASLAAAEKLGNPPGEIVIFGVEPERICLGVGLTDTLENKVPEIKNLLFEELGYAVHGK